MKIVIKDEDITITVSSKKEINEADQLIIKAISLFQILFIKYSCTTDPKMKEVVSFLKEAIEKTHYTFLNDE